MKSPQLGLMSSRYSAARPKRAGEAFARTHHGERAESDSKRVKFDVRNPSTLAPEAREEDAILDADVIGKGGGTKRGAVNLDGYDSDSENETFNARAQQRSRRDVNILQQLDKYDAKGVGPDAAVAAATDGDEDEDDDMFAPDAAEKKAATNGEDAEFEASGKKKKDVRFLDDAEIKGQDFSSRTRAHVRLGDEESSDDEEDIELAIQEEGVDDEVGAGGLKRNAPKVEAFNLKEEMEEGQFDEEGNYIRKGGDPDALHDNWLEGLSKKEMRKAAAAHEKREADARTSRLEEDDVLVSDLLRTLILRLERAETPLEALVRLGRGRTKSKKVPKRKLKMKDQSAESMEVDRHKESDDGGQSRIKESIHAITEAADRLLSRDHAEIYDQEREMLVREWRRETGEEWVEPDLGNSEVKDGSGPDRMWEFRWTDGRDGGGTQGPFDGAMMKAWQDAGYFGDGAEFRRADDGGEWSRAGSFA